MRWSATILDIGSAVVLWAAVLTTIRQRRARMTANPSLEEVQSRRLHEVAAMAAMIGVTWFIAWFITDATGPSWLHALSVPAALAFIAVGAVVAGYAAWIGGP
jgi:hypothetical protein